MKTSALMALALFQTSDQIELRDQARIAVDVRFAVWGHLELDDGVDAGLVRRLEILPWPASAGGDVELHHSSRDFPAPEKKERSPIGREGDRPVIGQRARDLLLPDTGVRPDRDGRVGPSDRRDAG